MNTKLGTFPRFFLIADVALYNMLARMSLTIPMLCLLLVTTAGTTTTCTFELPSLGSDVGTEKKETNIHRNGVHLELVTDSFVFDSHILHKSSHLNLGYTYYK